MSRERVIVALFAEFAKPEPLEVESQNAVLRVSDAPFLFELIGVSQGPIVPRHIQNCRQGSVQVLRLVQKRRRIKSWDNLKSQFTDAVTVSRFNHAALFELRRRVDPLFRPAMKHYIIHQVPPQSVRRSSPFSGRCRQFGWCRRCSSNVLAHLEIRHRGRHNLVLEYLAEVHSFTLRPPQRGQQTGQNANRVDSLYDFLRRTGHRFSFVHKMVPASTGSTRRPNSQYLTDDSITDCPTSVNSISEKAHWKLKEGTI